MSVSPIVLFPLAFPIKFTLIFFLANHIFILVNDWFFFAFSLVVIRGDSWWLVVTRGDSWSRVVTRGVLSDMIIGILSWSTGGPSSSCEMIILRNNSHGGIIRVCMGIFTTALRNKKIRQILKKNTSPYFHSVSFVIWPLTLMKRAHFSELFISRFSTYIRKAQGWTLHFRTPDPRSEKSKLKMTGCPQIQRRIQAHIL